MGPAELVFLVPITAIVLGVGGGIIQSILKSQERRLEMRLQAQRGQNEAVTQQLEALRAEIASLRDTSTQYDIATDHVVQELAGRLSRMEARLATRPASPVEETQHIGLHQG